MARGRHGVHRDIRFQDLKTGCKVNGRERPRVKEDDDRSRLSGRSEVLMRDTRDIVEVRARQKDIKERESMNGEIHKISLSASDSGGSSVGDTVGSKSRGVSIRDTDREPGELSSESGSDEPTESGSQSTDTKVLKAENENLPPYGKKRKFQRIVWDRDDKVVSPTSMNASKEIVLPPPPPLPESLLSSTNHFSQEGPRDFPIKDGKYQNKKNSPVMALLPHEANGDYAAKSPSDLSASVTVERQWGDDEVAGQVEEEDFVPTRHIGSSRWADDFKSPRDEGEINDEQGTRKRRKRKHLSGSLDATVHISPEDVEHDTEGNHAAKAQSSGSNEKGAGARSSIRYDNSDNVSDDNNSMNIDMEYENVDSGSSESANDSEGETHSDKIPEPEMTPQRSINMLKGCRSVDEFDRLNKIDEGTYGVVYRAKDKKTGEIVALKKVKMEREKEGFPLTSLREINILLSFHHQSIVDVKEVVVGSNLDSVFMVMEYMEHDLKGLMETMKQPYSQSEVKCLMLQLLEGTKYLHDNWVLHRDLKTSNLLLNNRGELKICDFGLSRQYGSPLKPYTHLVVTLWYRAPELLMGAKQYSTAIDMWSLGCIMAELLTKQPLFNGKNEVEQLDKIFRTLGTPSEAIWPGFSKLPGLKVNFVKHQYNMLRKKFPATSFTGSPILSESGFDLLNQLLTYDPEKRITAEAALNHGWFREVPLPKSKDFMPTFPAQHAQDRRARRVLKSPDPLAEQRRKELQQGELGTYGLFGYKEELGDTRNETRLYQIVTYNRSLDYHSSRSLCCHHIFKHLVASYVPSVQKLTYASGTDSNNGSLMTPVKVNNSVKVKWLRSIEMLHIYHRPNWFSARQIFTSLQTLLRSFVIWTLNDTRQVYIQCVVHWVFLNYFYIRVFNAIQICLGNYKLYDIRVMSVTLFS